MLYNYLNMQHIKAENRVNRPVTHNPSINKSIYIEGEFAKNLGVVFLQMANFPPGESAKEHVHQTMHEFFLPAIGHLGFVIEDHQFTAEPGDLVIIEAGEKHFQYNDTSEEAVVLCWGIATKT